MSVFNKDVDGSERNDGTKLSKMFVRFIIVTVVIILAILGLNSYKKGSAPKMMQISTTEGTATVYYKECGSFKGYVETLNNIRYNESYDLVEEYLPKMIFYSDSTGKNYIQNVADSSEYADFLNYLLYNEEFEIDFKFLPHYVMYEKEMN